MFVRRSPKSNTGRPLMSMGPRLVAACLTVATTACLAQDGDADKLPGNYIEVTALLSVSGQPTAAQLQTLKSRGFQAVIYIAPPTVGTTVKDEPLIIGKQGLLYANVPVDFGNPTQTDFDAFTRLLAAWKDKKVYVHCQVNMRGSVFMFLHRVINDKVPPEQAYEIVRRIWVPDKVWRTFLVDTLKRHGIAFDPM